MKTRGKAKSIKDLKDLRVLRGRACYRHAGPKGPEEKGETFFIVVRGPVPRDRSMARDRPSHYDEGEVFFHRSAGAYHRDVERVMKHPHLISKFRQQKR